ncbi:WD repeat-containing protein 91 isoform X1 [Halyomorpha halys]|uniref:WD repeat-containing protein 91 isoform X1 n=1 Tax=Halyomorpha halys TaxID=286706 RepID=UPI0006D4F11B|nr:WD repeat-containing protein 91 isoform X1 [Halyomorpha halys]
MAHIQLLDELVREYLLFRGFTITLKSFDAELKVDKDRGFRVDRIVDQFVIFINNYDLQSLRDLWTHFDQKIFSKLEYEFIPGVRKLESSLLKFYLANAIANNKSEKVVEFFNKMTPEIQGHPEWKDWFTLPFIKSPEDHPVFSVHFTKQWQDAFLVSLHNFLAIMYQVMPQPVLASYEEEATKLRRLQEENEALKHKLSALGQGSNIVPDAVPPMDIMDDFYIIAQETPSSGESQGRILKNFIRTIGGGIPTSPILGRKPQSHDESSGVQKHHSSKRSHASQASWIKYGNSTFFNFSAESVPKRSLSLDSRSRKGHRDLSIENDKKNAKNDNFLMLSQEQMSEHKVAIIQCKFNVNGTLVASSDSDGVLKVWSPSPTLSIISSFHFSTPITALCWLKSERFFLSGSLDGILRFHDAKDNKIIWELIPDGTSVLKDSKIVTLCCNHTERHFACTALNEAKKEAKLLVYDIKTHKLEQAYSVGEGGPDLTVNCAVFNHNGSLLIAGCSDGTVRILDIRNGDCLQKRLVHDGPIAGLDIAQDHNTFYTFGSDHKLCRHNLAQLNPEPVWTATLPSCSTQHGAQCFSLHQNGKHVLIACGENGTNIYQITNCGLQLMLHLRDHKSLLTACDWSTANQCATCLSAASDGIIRISTILTP